MSSTLATWCEEPTHWKRSWCWERLKARGEGDDRGWDGWMASLSWWTWVWASSRIGDEQGSLACCSPWGRKESDMTELPNWTERSYGLDHTWNGRFQALSLENRQITMTWNLFSNKEIIQQSHKVKCRDGINIAGPGRIFSRAEWIRISVRPPF